MPRRARAECADCGATWEGTLEYVSEVVDDHDRFHDVDIQAVATDGGWRRQEAHSVQQHAGVGDQEPRCTHTKGPLPCTDCLLDGGDDGRA